MPFRLGIGNHETISPKTRCEFAEKFASWLDRAELQGGKSPGIQNPSGGKPAAAKTSKGSDDKTAATALEECTKKCEKCEQLRSKTYYEWSVNGVDFIYLDNATNDQFDQPQMDWFNRMIGSDANNKDIRTVVVGMHKALPWSVSCDHSMNESPDGISSGQKVYEALANLQGKGKKVYLLASHSHYFMRDIFNTKHWRDQGAVLPGWIVGTAGAQRYPLPPAADLTKSLANVYGYLLGRVYPDGTIDFEFTELKSGDIPADVKSRYTESWVNEACFAGNRRLENKKSSEPPDYCKEPTAKTP